MDPDKEKNIALVKRHTSELGEFFDSVFVVVTYRDSDGGTAIIVDQDGNHYAVKGAVQEWLDVQKCATMKRISENGYE